MRSARSVRYRLGLWGVLKNPSEQEKRNRCLQLLNDTTTPLEAAELRSLRRYLDTHRDDFAAHTNLAAVLRRLDLEEDDTSAIDNPEAATEMVDEDWLTPEDMALIDEWLRVTGDTDFGVEQQASDRSSFDHSEESVEPGPSTRAVAGVAAQHAEPATDLHQLGHFDSYFQSLDKLCSLSQRFYSMKLAEHMRGGFTTTIGKFQAAWKVTDGGEAYTLQWTTPEGTMGDVVLPSLPAGRSGIVSWNGRHKGEIAAGKTMRVSTGGGKQSVSVRRA